MAATRPLNSSHCRTGVDTTVATPTSAACGASGLAAASLLQPEEAIAIAAARPIAARDMRMPEWLKSVRVLMAGEFLDSGDGDGNSGVRDDQAGSHCPDGGICSPAFGIPAWRSAISSTASAAAPDIANTGNASAIAMPQVRAPLASSHWFAT